MPPFRLCRRLPFVSAVASLSSLPSPPFAPPPSSPWRRWLYTPWRRVTTTLHSPWRHVTTTIPQPQFRYKLSATDYQSTKTNDSTTTCLPQTANLPQTASTADAPQAHRRRAADAQTQTTTTTTLPQPVYSQHATDNLYYNQSIAVTLEATPTTTSLQPSRYRRLLQQLVYGYRAVDDLYHKYRTIGVLQIHWG